MTILVLNAGSSSLKFRLFHMETLRPLMEAEEVLAQGKVERLGTEHARLTFRESESSTPRTEEIGAVALADAVAHLFNLLPDSVQTLDAIGHRIVHGGAQFHTPTRIAAATLTALHALTPLAPLHNPAGIAVIEAARQLRPDVPNVAVFDTAFHHDLPEIAALYALPRELSERLQLRRYGFHGISYRAVSERYFAHRGVPAEGSRLILCHLGNGASVCALRDGRSVETSMGFTPLEGLIMGTRSGDIDPGLLLYLIEQNHFTVEQLANLLNHQSGLLGLSGGSSSDMRDLEMAANAGDTNAELALACFAHRVRKYIGAYSAVLGGVDALIFTGGIGEHSATMRARICYNLDFLGLALDPQRNADANGTEPEPIGAGDGLRVWIVPTDEERQIARETYALLKETQ